MNELTWLEISRKNLSKNIGELRRISGKDRILCACVKGNAYGHGLLGCAQTFLSGGADWLGVNAVYEARALREGGIDAPIYVLGYVSKDQLEEAMALDLRIVLYNREIAEHLGKLRRNKNLLAPKVHIKIETGNNRQGVRISELAGFAEYCEGCGLFIEGITTHFANIEDTSDYSFAREQIKKFIEADEILRGVGIKVALRHCANSAATMLFENTNFDMLRPGIACYGMWPSKETFVSLEKEDKKIALSPAISWKSKIAQIKKVPCGEYIGYGCSFRATRDLRIAILPIGYYDGYDRELSNLAHVLIRGKRAPLRGRVCMNIIMADVSDISDVSLDDEAVLLGTSGEDRISAEQMAGWAKTINYEITTRINERIPRIFI